MHTHTIVITGGHTGLGLAASRQLLATTTAHLVWATRSTEAARKNAAQLAQADRISIRSLDLASLASVNQFADELIVAVQAGTLPPLGALVCNAGIQLTNGLHQTMDGIEQTFGVNHLAHFLLVDRLRPYLVQSGRVVVVSSGTHVDAPRIWQSTLFGFPAPVYLGAAALANGDVPAGLDPTGEKANQFRYATSKLCTLLFAYELNRRLRAAASGITVMAFDPGLMPGTGLARTNTPLNQWLWRNVLPIMRVFDGVNAVETSGRNLA